DDRTGEDESLGHLAEVACRHVLELVPTSAARYDCLCVLYQTRLQRPQDAESCYLKAIELDPKLAVSHVHLGVLYYQLQRPQDAEGCYLKAIELDPKLAAAHYSLGILYQGQLRRPQDAESCYLKAIELDPKLAA